MTLTDNLTPLQEKAILGVDVSQFTESEPFDSTIERFNNPSRPATVDNQFDYLILLKWINAQCSSESENSSSRKLTLDTVRELLPTHVTPPHVTRLPAPCNLAAWAQLDVLLAHVAASTGSTTTSDTDADPLLALALAARETQRDTASALAAVARHVAAEPAILPSATALVLRAGLSFPRHALDSVLRVTHNDVHALALWATSVREGETGEAQAVQRALGEVAATKGSTRCRCDAVLLLRAHVTLLRRGATDTRHVRALVRDICGVAGEATRTGTSDAELARLLEDVYGCLCEQAAASRAPAREVLQWAELAAGAVAKARPRSHGRVALWAHRAGDDVAARRAARDAVRADPDALEWLNLYAALLSGADDDGDGDGDGDHPHETAILVLTQLVERLEGMAGGGPEWRFHAVHSHLLLVQLLGPHAATVLPALFAFVNRVFPPATATPTPAAAAATTTTTTTSPAIKAVPRNTPIPQCVPKLGALLRLHRKQPANSVATPTTAATTTTATTPTPDAATLAFMWTTLARTLHAIGDTASALECLDEARSYTTTPTVDIDLYDAALRGDCTTLAALLRTLPPTTTSLPYATALVTLHSSAPTDATHSRLRKLSASPKWNRSPQISLLCDKPDVAVHGWFGLFIDDYFIP